MTGISKSQVSRLCTEIDERVNAFLSRPIEGDWPYLWIDATYVKTRQSGRIVSVAVIIAVRVNSRYACVEFRCNQRHEDGEGYYRSSPYPRCKPTAQSEGVTPQLERRLRANRLGRGTVTASTYGATWSTGTSPEKLLRNATSPGPAIDGPTAAIAPFAFERGTCVTTPEAPTRRRNASPTFGPKLLVATHQTEPSAKKAVLGDPFSKFDACTTSVETRPDGETR